MCLQILQPLQCANMLVQAYPFMFDMLAVVSIVAEEAGELPVRQLMAVGGTRVHPIKEEHNPQHSSSAAQELPTLTS